MPNFHQSNMRRAELVIAVVKRGRFLTAGQMRSGVKDAVLLPMRLRKYVFLKVEPSIEPKRDNRPETYITDNFRRGVAMTEASAPNSRKPFMPSNSVVINDNSGTLTRTL